MKSKNFIFSTAVIAGLHLFPATGFTQAFCPDLTNIDAYPDAFNWLAPVVYQEKTGTYFRPRDLMAGNALSPEESAALEQITNVLQDRGTRLAMVVTPPRLLTMQTASPDVTPAQLQDIRLNYDHIIRQLNELGIVAPDILAWLEDTPGTLDTFNLRQDTHWSPAGAGQAALSLRARLEEDANIAFPALGTNFVQSEETVFDFLGAFAGAVQQVCSVEIEPEKVAYRGIEANASDVSAESLLFGSIENAVKVALLGTSFSNKSNTDVFRWADAISYALQTQPENLAIEGGGVETSFLNAALIPDKLAEFDLVVWEVPWVSRKEDWSGRLRQILGTLQGPCSGALTRTVTRTISETDGWVTLFENVVVQDKIDLHFEDFETGSLDLRVFDAADETTDYRIARSDRLAPSANRALWSIFLADLAKSFPDGNPHSVQIRTRNLGEAQELVATTCSTVLN